MSNVNIQWTCSDNSISDLHLIGFVRSNSASHDNRPSTDKFHHFVRRKKEKRKKLWHVTSDMWHVTRDTWHVTRVTWHMTCLGGWTFSQNFSSLALTVCDLWYYEDLQEKADGLNRWINESMTRLFIEQPRLHRVCLIDYVAQLKAFLNSE